MLDSTIRKHAHKKENTLRHEPSYNQLQVKTERTWFLCENVTDITIRNSERKDTYKNKKMSNTDYTLYNELQILMTTLLPIY